MGIGPGQFKSLPHDETTKDLVKSESKGFQIKILCSVTFNEDFLPVPVLRLADNQVFQLGIFKPDRVGRLHPVKEKDSLVLQSSIVF